MKNLVMKIDGMQSDSGARKIISVLLTIENVVDIFIELEESKIIVAYEDDIDIENIKKMIEDIGFNVVEANSIMPLN